MIFHPTKLKGAYIIDLEPFRDNRGLFARTFCQKEFKSIGHQKEFLQMNHSRTVKKGTIRGLHYQQHPHAEIKLIRCIRGAVFDVIVDLRKDSPQFLQHISVELSEDNMRMIYVPEGFAHGFQTLEDHTELIYHHTAFYRPEAEAGLKFDDPALEIEWPLELSEISAKDQLYTYVTQQFRGLALSQGNY